MEVFELRNKLIRSYQEYATSFMRIRDTRIKARVDSALAEGKLWPHPQLGLNPAFASGGSVGDLVAEGLLHPDCEQIFRAGKSHADGIGKEMKLHQHQADAIRAARADRNYVLTTGTGSGKSLSYIIPIVDHVLRTGSGQGTKAIVVYPMNALANSQMEELEKFLGHGPWGNTPPVSFKRYTGQEDDEARQSIRTSPPDIILTNYVMLELVLTRYLDRKLVSSLDQLRFLVLDELHTYRGRQGADVALLVRRLREASGSEHLRCVGTSATLSTEGSHSDRQARVADVASLLFGAKVEPREVISETLERITTDRDVSDPSFVSALAERLRRGDLPPTGFDAFVTDPLSVWIESTFGLSSDGDRITRATPRSIEGPSGGASDLAASTGVDVDRCRDLIRAQLIAGYQVHNPQTGFPVFAFRLHQFLSRGDTVYASPELPKDRYSTLDRQRFVPNDRSRSLLPLAFCRACGQDYYVTVAESTDTGSQMIPRDLGDTGTENPAGFLYISETQPWPSDEQEVLDRVPEEWLDDRGLIPSNRKKDLPRQVWVQPDGRLCDPDAEGSVAAAWILTPFRFCLSCGVSYAGRLGRDYTRLTTLGSEGRSTATTIMSLAAIRDLRADDELEDEAKKLLSFTDNRQDASLQAGHFNDFVQVTLLRAAVWRAAADAGPDGMVYDEVPQRVFEALNLPFENYAHDPDLRGAARTDTDRVLREVLAYHVYRDLVRGWRLTQPNLEQTGLLSIEYESLGELAADEEQWSAAPETIRSASPALREHILQVLLDAIRRELAIKVEVLDRTHQEGLQRRDNGRLDGTWSIDGELLEYATVVFTRSRKNSDTRHGQRCVYISSRSGFGQFLRRTTVLAGDGKITLDETTEIIEILFDGLRRYGLVEVVDTDSEGDSSYQLPASAMRWKAGDGSAPYHDHIRMPNLPDEHVETNQFFVDLYKSVGEDLLGVEAREHTAQVRFEDRLDREERFRRADLPVLYCSPTMELGVDISQLNVVNMRNVPPTPANYAQRSGRAGRSGQPALVFTYCSAGSSHDQHFFRQPELMVAGQVEAPRLELANEDLLRAHVHAVWLAESGLDLGKSMTDVLDLAVEGNTPSVFPSVAAHLGEASYRARARVRAAAVLADLDERLQAAPWWTETWLDDTLNAVPAQFDNALRRWRSLYRSALQQAQEQSRIKQSAGRPAGDRRQAERLRRQAENQLDLLRADSDNRNQSDFYTYRYFAAEGFLPGYSFPRLPLSAFIPGQRGGGDPEFVQRPRFLAIKEFGPQSLIYHEGARYRINQVILPVGDADDDSGGLVTTQVKRCDSCGYLHPVPKPPGPDVCRRCGEELPAPMRDLFRLQNVSTVRRDRITSDEEERQRKGYEIISGVHFAERSQRLSVDEAEVVVDDSPVLKLSYGDTATIWRINLGWRRRENKEQLGFLLDVERGYWESEKGADADLDPEDPMSKRRQRVVPYVEDTRNALLIEPAVELNAAEMATLEATLKVAFQVVFQLEESELATEPLPSLDERRTLLFYESAEGGAGVLRRLVDEPDLWPRIANEALRRMHVDHATMGDIDEPCEAACYDCLLSYQNQIDHQMLDRQVMIPMMGDLRSAGLNSLGNPSEKSLMEQVDSSLEAAFLEYLTAHGLRMPDRAQVHFAEIGATPDFVYDEACAVVFVDGPHHDPADRQARDEQVTATFRDAGYRVIRFRHRDDWAQTVNTYRSVFKQGET